MGNSRRAKRASQQKSRPSRPAASPSGTAGPGRGLGKIVAWGVGVLALVALVVFISRDVSENPQGRADPPPGVEVVQVAQAFHTTDPVEYETTPGAGGPHHPEWLTCRAYSDPIPEANAVHTLEHGAIWITYDPDRAEPADIEKIEDFTRSSQVMSSPYPGLDSTVVLTAWARQLRLDTVDEDTIDQFIRAFRDATAPEIAAGC